MVNIGMNRYENGKNTQLQMLDIINAILGAPVKV